MYSDTDSGTALIGAAVRAASRTQAPCVWEPFKDWPPVELLSHGEQCCYAAARWVTLMDGSFNAPFELYAGPRWLSELFRWGPAAHPLHWCDAVRRRRLDCGALAAISNHIFLWRGLDAFRVQLVQRFTAEDGACWAEAWQKEGADASWVCGEFIYHEACAVAGRDGAIRVWDPSAASWADPSRSRGYGSIAAIKISGAADELSWSHHRLPPGKWTAASVIDDDAERVDARASRRSPIGG